MNGEGCLAKHCMQTLNWVAMNIVRYVIRETASGYWVGHVDKTGKWWEASPKPFVSFEDADLFRNELQQRHDNYEVAIFALEF